MQGYIYLATPYSNYEAGHERAFRDAVEQCALLNRAGYPTFSPIVHSHPLVVHGGMEGQTDYEAWRELDEAMMYGSSAMVVCMLKGYERSRGVRAEIDWYVAAGRSHLVFHMTPSLLPAVLKELS